MDNISGGYVLQPRSFDGSEASKMPPCTREVWFFILRNANHKDNSSTKRGQCFLSISNIQDALHWHVGYRKMEYTKTQVAKSLRRLREDSMIDTTKTTRGMIITICNYDIYQDPKNYEGHNEGTTKATRRKSSGDTINKNGKECKNEEVIPEWLDADLWVSFLEMRKTIKAPMTDKAKKMFFTKLDKLISEGHSQKLLFEKAIINNWKSVFPDKDTLEKKGKWR